MIPFVRSGAVSPAASPEARDRRGDVVGPCTGARGVLCCGSEGTEWDVGDEGEQQHREWKWEQAADVGARERDGVRWVEHGVELVDGLAPAQELPQGEAAALRRQDLGDGAHLRAVELDIALLARGRLLPRHRPVSHRSLHWFVHLLTRMATETCMKHSSSSQSPTMHQ